jgi:hypothetical protein
MCIEKWTEVEVILFREIIQAEKDTYSIFSRNKVIIITIIMGYKCQAGLLRVRFSGREEKRELTGEHDQSTLYVYEDSIMKFTKYCFKGRKRKRVRDYNRWGESSKLFYKFMVTSQ